MARFVAGDIVVIPFPFSDLTATKKRPALVLQSLSNDDLILCQITSKFKSDKYSIAILHTDFAEGALPLQSFARPNRLFTADEMLILYKAGTLEAEKMAAVVHWLIEILRPE